MTFNESSVRRDTSGRFDEKPQTAPEAALPLYDPAEGLEEYILALPEESPWRSDPERLRAIVLNLADSTSGGDLPDIGDPLNKRTMVHRLATADALARAHNVTPSIPGDESWPSALDSMGSQAPTVLWSKGDMSVVADQDNVIQLAGARAATSYGEHVTAKLAEDLAQADKTVLSSGQYGIAGTAVRASAAAGGKSAILAVGGLERPYPAGHQKLFDRVGSSGVLISENAPGIAPTKARNIRRNIVASVLSGKTVVVEAGSRSGSLQSAYSALHDGRAVGAVPGPVTSAASAGTNALLGEGAKVVMSAEDILNL